MWGARGTRQIVTMSRGCHDDKSASKSEPHNNALSSDTDHLPKILNLPSASQAPESASSLD
jgi:hypothetical protein